MTDTTKPKSGGDLETEAMQVDEDERLPQEVTTPTTNAVDNSGFAIWCKDNGLNDQVVEALWGAGFRTPKDLIDRKSDLKKLNLEIDDYMIIGGAIERMRNANASNSVDSAVLGLTTKDSAARDDAAADAQRAAELDEQIRQAFKTYRRENQLNSQRQKLKVGTLLKNPLPYVQENVTFIASTLYVGDAFAKLCEAVKFCFAPRKQDRKPTAIVQAFGCGKTRAAIELTEDYIVLPLELLPKRERNRLTAALVAAQVQLKADIDAKRTQDIMNFSEGCLRLVHLVLFSLLALLNHCMRMEMPIVDPSERRRPIVDPSERKHRYDLAVLLACDTKPLMDWLVAYFEQNRLRILKMTQGEFESEVRKQVCCIGLPKKVVFALDEAHGILEYCQAFCLHEEQESRDIMKLWLRENELVKSEKAPDTVTNLYYQFRLVMRDYLDKDDNHIGFVMCSTAFKIWTKILDASSPRGETVRFWDLQWFTVDNVKQCIQHYFCVAENLFTEERVALLAEFRRPSFVAELLRVLASKIVFVSNTDLGGVEISIGKWLDDCIATASRTVEIVMNGQIQELSDTKAACNYTPHRLAYLVYTMDKLCGGKMVLKDDVLSELVQCGVVRFITYKEVTCDDPLFIRAIDNKINELLKAGGKSQDPVIKEVLSPTVADVCSNLSAKGFAAERILAWLTLRGGLQATANGLGLQIQFRPGPAFTCRSGTADQLQDLLLRQPAMAADIVFQTIMERKCRYVLFPQNHCGPDLLFRHKNGNECIVAVQSKMHTKGGPFALEKFNGALRTLNPANYFSRSKKKDGLDTSRTKQRTQWMTHKKQFEQWNLQRIVFVALGFALRVQYLVREYNAAQQRRGSQSFIYLLNLHDLKKQVDNQNYACLEELLQEKCTQPKVQEDEELMLQSEWNARNKNQDIHIDVLKKMCDVRGINVTWTPEDIAKKARKDKKPYDAKTTAELISFLDEYKAEEELAELKWDLP